MLPPTLGAQAACLAVSASAGRRNSKQVIILVGTHFSRTVIVHIATESTQTKLLPFSLPTLLTVRQQW